MKRMKEARAACSNTVREGIVVGPIKEALGEEINSRPPLHPSFIFCDTYFYDRMKMICMC